jgi:hypothetical protein
MDLFACWNPHETNALHNETFRLGRMFEKITGVDRKVETNAGHRGRSTAADSGRTE